MSKQFVHVHTMTVRHLISLDCFMFFPSMLPLIKTLRQHAHNMSKPYNFRTKTRKTNVMFSLQRLFYLRTNTWQTILLKHTSAKNHLNKSSKIIQALFPKNGPKRAKKHRFSGDNPKRFSDPIKFESSVSGANSLDPWSLQLCSSLCSLRVSRRWWLS